MNDPQAAVPPSRVYRIFIVEDHPIIRKSYALLLAREADLEISGEATTAQQALVRLAAVKHHLPDLVLVDVSLPDINGISLIRQLMAQHPDLPMLAISGHDDELYAKRALEAGARGYLNKIRLTEAMVTTIRHVLGSRRSPAPSEHI